MKTSLKTKHKVMKRNSHEIISESETSHSSLSKFLPDWFVEYIKVLQHINCENMENTWCQAYDKLWGEVEWQDNDFGSIARSRPIVFCNLDEDKKKAYEEILKCKSVGVDLDTPIFHFTTFGNLNEAVKRGGFVLVQPKDWSVNWEDTAFKNLLRENKGSVGIKSLVNAYMKDSYGMCWTLDADNNNVIEMEKKKHPSESIVIIESTARKLLNAYITDNISARACCIVKIKYLSGKKLREKCVNPNDLQNGDAGTDVHHDSISITRDKFAEQDEVRLIVEDCSSCVNKTVMDISDKAKNQRETKLIRHINLYNVIRSIRVIDNNYLFKC